jgi:hypothetical protein
VTATSTSTSTSGTFVTVPGDRHSEVAHTLAEPVPQALSVFDQLGLWGNLGVSLLGFTGAIFVLQPGGAGPSKAIARRGPDRHQPVRSRPCRSRWPGSRHPHRAPAMVPPGGLFGARPPTRPPRSTSSLGWGSSSWSRRTAAHGRGPGAAPWAYILG